MEDETRTTTVEILRVVHSLVQNMNVVMGGIDGEQTHSVCYSLSVEHFLSRWKAICQLCPRWYLGNSWYVLWPQCGDDKPVPCLSEC